jgi:hypothetical protein
MLIDLLRKDTTISPYFCNECVENDVSIDIDQSISNEEILIIKVDNYYNANVPIDLRPKSPDCLIIQRCSDNTYIIYIVELKNIANQDGFTVKGIEEKFITCLDDFMSVRFANYFHDNSFNYSSIKLYFISDPYGFKNDPEKQLKMRGHKLDLLISIRIPRYFNQHLYIDPKIPNPKINNCRN